MPIIERRVLQEVLSREEQEAWKKIEKTRLKLNRLEGKLKRALASGDLEGAERELRAAGINPGEIKFLKKRMQATKSLGREYEEKVVAEINSSTTALDDLERQVTEAADRVENYFENKLRQHTQQLRRNAAKALGVKENNQLVSSLVHKEISVLNKQYGLHFLKEKEKPPAKPKRKRKTIVKPTRRPKFQQTLEKIEQLGTTSLGGV